MPAARVETLRWTPDLDRRVLGVAVAVTGAALDLAEPRLRVRLSLRGELLADTTCAVLAARTVLDIGQDQGRLAHDRRAYLWWPDHPNRIHQKVEDPRFLHWCDRLGVAVWTELPSALSCTPSGCVRPPAAAGRPRRGTGSRR